MSAIAIKCKNPQCNHQFSSPLPLKPGYYTSVCPKCKNVRRWHYPPEPQAPLPMPGQKEEVKEGYDADGNYIAKCKNPKCGKYMRINPKLLTSGKNQVMCRNCQGPISFYVPPTESDKLKCSSCGNLLEKPLTDGSSTVVCKDCAQKYTVTVRGGTVESVSPKTMVPLAVSADETLMLEVNHPWWKAQKYLLTPGLHYVGRKDVTNQSDFMIDDKKASRRSVLIAVEGNPPYLKYKMAVINATNPVKLNGKIMNVGEVIFIRDTDAITLGNTIIYVRKCK